MCTEKLNEMQKILKEKGKKPIFFIGSGLSRRYLGSPDWNGLLRIIAEDVQCDYQEIKNVCGNKYEKIAQELEYYCFRNADSETLNNNNRRSIFREKIAKIFQEYCVKFQESIGKNDGQNLIENVEFNKNINIKLKELETNNYTAHQYVQQYKEIADKMNEYSEEYRRNLEIQELRKIKPKAIITTNYDTMLEDIIYDNKMKRHIGQEWFVDSTDKEDETDLYKIHGCITQPETIIITQEDYNDFFLKSKYLYAKILTLFWEYPLIFMGYSISDRNIKDVLTTIVEILPEEQREEFSKHIWVLGRSERENDNKFSEKEIELLNGKSLKVQCFDLYDYREFFSTISSVTNNQKFGNLKFCISENVIELLIQPLYEQQDNFKVVTRELLQNALDACKGKNVNSDIKITIEEVGGELYLEVEDNGIGMDINDIRTNFLTVGKSNKNNVGSGLVGKYGIGVLSLFLIGDYANVYTMKENSNPLAFKLHIVNDKKQVTWIDEFNINNNSIMEGITSFTKIRVKLKSKEKEKIFNLKNEADILRILGLNEYVTNENNKIVVTYKQIPYEIPKLKVEDYFYKVDEEISIYKSEWLDADKREKLDTKLKSVYEQNDTIFFNDMVSKATYKWDKNSMIKEKQVPFVVLNIKNLDEKNDEFKTTLSRNSIELTGLIAGRIKSGIYTLEIEKIADIIQNYFQAVKNNEYTIKELRKLLMRECNIFGKNADILIKNNKLFISNNRLLTHLEIWGSNEWNSKIIRNVEDKIVLYKDCNMHKSSIADLIESDNLITISNMYFDEYIFRATGPNNGLRTDALRRILKFLEINEVNKLVSSTEVWSYVKNNKEIIKKKYTDISHNGMLWFKEEYREEFEYKYGNEKVVIFTSEYLDNPIDDTFGRLLIDNLKKKELENILEVL